jgi:hypothetical protein
MTVLRWWSVVTTTGPGERPCGRDSTAHPIVTGAAARNIRQMTVVCPRDNAATAAPPIGGPRGYLAISSVAATGQSASVTYTCVPD